MSPLLGSTEVHPKRVTLQFDEYIKMANAQEKVIISPPQINEPELKTVGKKISVQLRDTLKENTTYTIDFSDAIEDYNEGNPLGTFTYYFSTGKDLDTMEVAGYVLQASDLTPMKGILVGLHSNLADSAFRTLPFDRVSRTDADGRFSIKGVARGEYRIYALNDQDRDFKFSLKGEEIAFDTALVRPSCYPDIRYDTIWKDTLTFTAVTPVPYTHFTPDNLMLLAFREGGQIRSRLKEQRAEPESFQIIFSAPSDSTPVLRGLNFDEKQLLAIRSVGNDTLTYWVNDTTLLKQDTLRFELHYTANNDTSYVIEQRLDTLELVPRLTYERRAKMKEKEMEKWNKQVERRRKRGDFSYIEPPRTYLKLKTSASDFSPLGNFHITLPEPLQSIDTAGIHLVLQVNDSTLHPARYRLDADLLNPLALTLRAEWRAGQNYQLTLDSACFVSIYGNPNKAYESSIRIGETDSYGTLFVKLKNASDSMVVQMLQDENKVYRQTRAKNGVAEFYYLEPGKYYLRAFSDDNGDMLWSPGSYDDKRPAEALYYFPAELTIRANWDIDQTWDVLSLPFTRQKPEKFRKEQDNKKNINSAAERNRKRLEERNK